MRILKFFLLATVLLFIFSFSPAVAQTPEVPSSTSLGDQAGELGKQAVPDEEQSRYTLDPKPSEIFERTPSVKITFNDLESSEKYVLCTGSNVCVLPDNQDQTPRKIPTTGILGLLSKDANFIPSTSTPLKHSGGPLTLTVCGDSQKAGKISMTKCDKNSFFYGGKFYAFSIGTYINDIYTPIERVIFYVGVNYPEFEAIPDKNIKQNTNLQLSIKAPSPPSNGITRTNKYVLVATGPIEIQALKLGDKTINISSPIECLILRDNETKTINLRSFGNYGDIIKNLGSYAFYLRAPSVELDSKNCGTSGFVYYKMTCSITDKDPGGTCKTIKDPNKAEYSSYLKQLDKLGGAGSPYRLPCSKRVDGTLDCTKLDTAIGPIDVRTPEAFILAIFKFTLTIASFGGVILIMVSGYIMMTSAGDKEKISGARETITAAIVGLLFIILSIVILEVIGVDILRIPGFGK